ncbi:Metallo-dependent hydrolase [Suhomyces tanzawaensis NRRL Y-17324]|uniref:Metallo-dependent hydrolase n=1 Tax=Suhomyces tanzawaensis NRRL Y-17324 TaxID=984487 RepID=A0A1E4SIR1_9ASCO|nr:Metallo-dependent hydrolase [Suhomyces tanzawaensis NRRL Y-17324]ODV79395.1 Metallo-dependent hydrolase [Suhomyces tanzawaensis NRRL Y-17324]
MAFPTDNHCHLSVQCTEDTVKRLAGKLTQNSPTFHVMSTYAGDLDLLDQLLDQVPGPSVVPYYGVHPWYSHLFTTRRPHGQSGADFKHTHYSSIMNPAPPPQLLEVLPDPIHIDDHLEVIRGLIEKHAGLEYGIGEIGLDKPFRVPTNGYFGAVAEDDAESGPKLTQCRVSMDHQVQILEKQLQLADSLGVKVSVHCVKAHGALYDSVSKYANVKVILHSYSGLVDQAKIWIRNYRKSGQSLQFSFSNWINGVQSKTESLSQIVDSLEKNQVLGETDMLIDEWLLEKEDEYWAGLNEIYRKIGKK